MAYPVKVQLITNNRATQVHKPARADDWLKPKGEVVHSTDTQGATAQNIRDYFQTHPSAQASAHRVIGWDGIIQMIPENEIAWQAGWTANHMYLSTELCEPKNSDPDRFNKFKKVWDMAVWAIANDCVRYGWQTGPDIWSHYGISQRYPKETNHTDPYGYFQRYGKTWAQFLAAVDAEIARQKAPATVVKAPAPQQPASVQQVDVLELQKQLAEKDALIKQLQSQVANSNKIIPGLQQQLETLQGQVNSIKKILGV